MFILLRIVACNGVFNYMFLNINECSHLLSDSLTHSLTHLRALSS
jgi:hypothetical protein